MSLTYGEGKCNRKFCRNGMGGCNREIYEHENLNGVFDVIRNIVKINFGLRMSL